MEGLTINEAAETTGWSPRMLRYIESAGLIELPRTVVIGRVARSPRAASARSPPIADPPIPHTIRPPGRSCLEMPADWARQSASPS